jgi:aspartate/methionine/tyrosine aminotransferase
MLSGQGRIRVALVRRYHEAAPGASFPIPQSPAYHPCMPTIIEKFAKLGTDHAPGQEVRQGSAAQDAALRGDALPGTPVDFSHGDVNDNAFAPTPGALEEFVAGVHRGGSQAYTEYRGGAELRERIAERLTAFTGRPVSGADELIITPGTQGALFLALGATVNAGDRVAIVRPDYFANRKLVEFLGGVVVPVRMDYLTYSDRAGLDLGELEDAFKSGVTTFLFSNPNNPAGVVYSPAEIARIAELATKYGVSVIVDQLYSRLLYRGIRTRTSAQRRSMRRRWSRSWGHRRRNR